VLAGIASAGMTLKFRKLTTVRWQDDAWIYKWRGAKLPHPVIGSALHPEEAGHVLFHEYVPKPGDVVFDVGAGVGDTSLLFSRFVGDRGKVIAVEAHPDTFGWLTRLCRLNGLENVTPLQLAVSDRDGELVISDEASLSNSVVDRDEADLGLTVPARRLDSIALDLGVETIDFLKMYIVGAERLALGGMEEMIGKTRHVCISCHDFMADRGGSDQMRTKAFVSDFLTAHGFALTSRENAADWILSYVYGRNTNYP
jgi:FkbM family methyltransferase